MLLLLALARAADPDGAGRPASPHPGDPPPPPPPPACPEVPIGPDGSFDWPGGGPISDGAFDWPVAPPTGEGWYDIQPFGTNRHLGADLNAYGGTRVGDPVYAVADGCVVFARDIWRGWGNVVRIVHVLPDGGVVESFYAHFDRIETSVGAWITRGTRIGTVGTGHGTYGPHLHLEIRDQVGLPQGPGYGMRPGYVDPMAFIEGR